MNSGISQATESWKSLTNVTSRNKRLEALEPFIGAQPKKIRQSVLLQVENDADHFSAIVKIIERHPENFFAMVRKLEICSRLALCDLSTLEMFEEMFQNTSNFATPPNAEQSRQFLKALQSQKNTFPVVPETQLKITETVVKVDVALQNVALQNVVLQEEKPQEPVITLPAKDIPAVQPIIEEPVVEKPSTESLPVYREEDPIVVEEPPSTDIVGLDPRFFSSELRDFIELWKDLGYSEKEAIERFDAFKVSMRAIPGLISRPEDLLNFLFEYLRIHEEWDEQNIRFLGKFIYPLQSSYCKNLPHQQASTERGWNFANLLMLHLPTDLLRKFRGETQRKKENLARKTSIAPPKIRLNWRSALFYYDFFITATDRIIALRVDRTQEIQRLMKKAIAATIDPSDRIRRDVWRKELSQKPKRIVGTAEEIRLIFETCSEIREFFEQKTRGHLFARNWKILAMRINSWDFLSIPEGGFGVLLPLEVEELAGIFGVEKTKKAIMDYGFSHSRRAYKRRDERSWETLPETPKNRLLELKQGTPKKTRRWAPDLVYWDRVLDREYNFTIWITTLRQAILSIRHVKKGFWPQCSAFIRKMNAILISEWSRKLGWESTIIGLQLTGKPTITRDEFVSIVERKLQQ